MGTVQEGHDRVLSHAAVRASTAFLIRFCQLPTLAVSASHISKLCRYCRSIEIEKLKSKDEDGLASLKKKLEKVEATTKAMKKTQEAAKKSQDELLALVKKMAGTVDAVKANVTAGAQTIRDDESVGASSVGFRSESVY